MIEPSSRPPAARVRGLYVLADDDPRWRRDPVEQAQTALRGGASVVQLRVKHATDRQTLAWAAAIRRVADAHGALFLVNDRFDLALAARADGVHLGQEDLPPAAIPRSACEKLLVGRSTHSVEQARASLAEPVDYIAFGPVFRTPSKDSPYTPRGVARLAQVVRLVAPRPVVAIGGLDAKGAAEAVRSGAAAVAVISAVAGAPDPEAAARELTRALGESNPR